MNLLRYIYTYFFKPLGFSGAGDLLSSAYGIKLYAPAALMVQVSGTLLAAVLSFCTEWIWDPPRALVLLCALDLLNGYYGYKVDKKLNAATWEWDKAERTAGKLISTVLILVLFRNAVASYDYYKIGADAIFGWLFTQKLRKLVLKMVAIKAQEGDLPAMIQSIYAMVLGSKYGPGVVDSIQKASEGVPAVPVVVVPPPPAEEPTQPDQPTP